MTPKIRAMQSGEYAGQGFGLRMAAYETDAEAEAFLMGMIKSALTARETAKLKAKARPGQKFDITDAATLEDIGEGIANRLLAMSRRLSGAAHDPANLSGFHSEAA